ncbi:hypothetical protein BSKO_13463 [Bryopsis sp. KO-2023]|nr:hypothetical protein BSKO_13463 [Bryopsis sp. KO-2023]
MTSLLKSLLRSDSSDMAKSPSFNDFSMHVGQEVEREPQSPTMEEAPMLEKRSSTSSVGSPGSDVWRSVFNPGRNYSLHDKNVGRTYYDTVDDPKKQPTTWEYIVKADHLKQVSFAQFDKNADGFISADELRSTLGPSANVDALIKQADKNGDGKIDYKEFCSILKDS